MRRFAATVRQHLPSRHFSSALEQEREKGLVSYLRHPSRDQEVYLIGTVHISKQSSRMVTDLIASVKPDVVMVELCAVRRDKVMAMARGQGETVLDSLLRAAGVTKQTAAQYVGAGMISSLDMYFRGNEMLAGIQAAEANKAQLLLGDQEASRTMRRLRESASQMSPFDIMRLLQGSVMPQFKDAKAKELYERLWQLSSTGGEAPLPSRVQMQASMSHMKEILPAAMLEAMLTERDVHMAKKLLDCRAQRIVGVVGMAHMDGIERVYKAG